MDTDVSNADADKEYAKILKEMGISAGPKKTGNAA